MWWRDLVNRYAHGQPMPWQSASIWRCEECGGHVFRVLAWDRWVEDRTVVNRYVLECEGCGRLEANICESIRVG